MWKEGIYYCVAGPHWLHFVSSILGPWSSPLSMCISNKFLDAAEAPVWGHTSRTTDFKAGEREDLRLKVKWLQLWGEWAAETRNHAGPDDMIYLFEFFLLSIHLPANSL